MKILFVIDTYHRGRHVLLDIPFTNCLKKNNEIETDEEITFKSK